MNGRELVVRNLSVIDAFDEDARLEIAQDAIKLITDLVAELRTNKGCGCKTAEQTGTANGYMCHWHRERYLAAIDAARKGGA